jgi:autotransporter passenger strand-loop-strand repeat protein
VETVFAGGIASATQVHGFGQANVLGSAAGMTVSSGGMAIVYSGGTASGSLVSGGELVLESGGKASGSITFAGSGGLVKIYGTTMPTAVFSGFVSSDEIVLAGVTYSAGATVSVRTSGVVTISNGTATYNLDIAGAAVGSTNYSFGSGSVLTTTINAAVVRQAAPAAMAFLRPAAAPAQAAADFAVLPTAAGPEAAKFAPPAVMSAGPRSHGALPDWRAALSRGELAALFNSRGGF